MKSAPRGRRTSVVEVTNISRHGFWILLRGRELFLPFAKFPWFEAAAVGQILDVRLAGPGHLHWPQLDVDLAVRSIEAPDEFPLVSRTQPKATPKRAARPASKKAARSQPRPRRS